MLFAYPREAAALNWLHDSLSEMIRNAMDRVDANRARIVWPDLIPADRRARLSRFSQLEERFDEVIGAYETLGQAERAVVREAMNDQSALTELFYGDRAATVIGLLPEVIQEPIKKVFEKAFAMLTAVGIRDHNYRTFIQLVEHRICAFCGCESFAGAGSKREPLDHYLATTLYPFAGANAKNLVPMGSRCNSSYKLAQDVLRNRTGGRRRCFDPYSPTPVGISLLRSTLFARSDGYPAWEVDFQGDAERIATWDDVFDIRARFSDSLDALYRNSIKIVGTLWTSRRAMFGGEDIRAAFLHMKELSHSEGWSDRAFLKVALYELLYSRYAAGGEEAARIEAEYTTIP